MSAQPNPASPVAQEFHSIVKDYAQGREISPSEFEERINRANAMIYLLSSTLAHEVACSDSHSDRKDSTICGISEIDADLRDSLSSMLVF